MSGSSSIYDAEIDSPDEEILKLLAEADRRAGRKDLIFFVDHFLKTFDPRPEAYPHVLNFELYGFQEDFIHDVLDAIINGYDVFIEKSRDMGASWCVLAIIFWLWLQRDGFQAIIGSRKEDYVDKTGDVSTLFGKFDFMIQNIRDPKVLPPHFSMEADRTYMSLRNPDNGNGIFGESSNPNFSRAGRYSVALFDEFGFWRDAKAAWTAAGDSTRCRIAITTPPDVPSYAKVVRFSGKTKVITLHWSQHPLKDEDWYEREQQRRSEEEVLHELDISWEYTAAGRPYPEADNLPFGSDPSYQYNPVLPLYVSIDLGLDAVALEWWQPVPNTDWWTLVDAYEKSDQIIDWFFPFFGAPIDSSSNFHYTDEDLAMIEHVKMWKRGVFFGDPSGNQRHIESKESAYRKLQLKQKIYVQTNTADNNFKARREAFKTLLPRIRVNDTPGTRWAIECWKNAHYPKRPEESNTTSPIVLPVHDWTSHHRTSGEFFAVNYKTYHVAKGETPGGTGRERRYDPETGRLLS